MTSNSTTDVDKLIAFGQMALEQGWYDKAREYFQQALALDASNLEAMKGLARANEILSRRMPTPAEPARAEPAEPPRKVSLEPAKSEVEPAEPGVEGRQQASFEPQTSVPTVEARREQPRGVRYWTVRVVLVAVVLGMVIRLVTLWNPYTPPPVSALTPILLPTPVLFPTRTPPPVSALTPIPFPTHTPRPPAGGGSHVSIGQEGRLYVEGADHLQVCIDEKTLDEVVHAVAVGDKYGFVELMESGRVFSVPNNTKVLVLDKGGFLYSEKSKVRILEGLWAGKAGWVPQEWVTK
jgi:hypothetical protein